MCTFWVNGPGKDAFYLTYVLRPLNTESKPSNNVPTLSSTQPGDLQQFQEYENPGFHVNIAAEYDYPNNETFASNSLKNSQKDYDITYDYATREETVSKSPQDSHHYNQDKLSHFHDQSSQLSASPLYQTVEDEPQDYSHKSNGDSGDRCGNIGQPSEIPFYHTLEDNTGMTQNEGVYEALNEGPRREPFYYVLEESK